MRPLIAGNWKMHGLKADLHEIDSIAAAARTQPMSIFWFVRPRP